MRVLITGGSGMLGSDLVSAAAAAGIEALAPSHQELDIADPSSVAELATGKFGPLDWCVNCAAYTAVDKAESEPQLAAELNSLGPGYLARAVMMTGARLLHVSTDFVFDGRAATPYEEDAPTNPLGVYGRTKRDGEEAVLGSHPNAVVVRTSWLYGPNGQSFPRTMIRAFEAGNALRVVADQIGSPTYTADLSRTILDLIDKNPFPGVYHATGPDAISWHAFAVLTLEQWKMGSSSERPLEVAPIRTEEWPTPAGRPPYSVLSNRKLADLGVGPMRPTVEALAEFCRRLSSPL